MNGHCSQMNINTIKRTIVDAIKDLDHTDHIDLCSMIKSDITDESMINETQRGTFINLDNLDEQLLQQLAHMIFTKLQRISDR